MQVWQVPLDIDESLARAALAVLDEPERARGMRMPDPRVRRRYIAAHAALRQILSSACGKPPHQLKLRAGPEGKPCLDEGPAFNLSHSGDLALVAVDERPGADVGVDLEMLANAPAASEMAAVFSPDEMTAIAAQPEPSRGLALLRCWTRKEALLKAVGCGLDDDTRSFTVSVGPEARLLASSHPRLDTGGWALAALEPTGEWTGAVAARGDMPPVRHRHWEWLA